MGILDFIKNYFQSGHVDEEISVSDGRAVCKICEKKLDGQVYSIKGHNGYYCKKHAKQVLENIRNNATEENTININESEGTTRHPVDVRKYPGHCEFQSCKNKPRGLDIFYCKRCEKYHCPKHRVAENHNCTGDLAILPNEGRISYSRK